MSNHDHNNPGHSHIPNNERKIAVAALLTGSFMFAEVFGGLISGSLALIADAAHMLTDFASLMLAWFAISLSRRPADWKRTFGYDRFSVLAAYINGLSLFVIAAWICYEAYKRLSHPHEILGGMMLWVAAIGLLVNIIAFWVLSRGENNNLNVRAAALHVAGDLLGSVAALIASVIIIYTDWTPIDPILSVVVALIILRSAWFVVKEAAQILLEAAPKGLDRRILSKSITTDIDEVIRIDHVHAWSITQERPMITLEATLTSNANAQAVKKKIKALLLKRFGVDHSTVEIMQS